MSEKVACKDCHKPKIKYRDAPLTCIGCHKKDDKHKGSLGDKCVDCHAEKSWKDIQFDHDKSDFKLRGAHAEAKVACKDCHKDNLFKQTPKDCYSCHKKDDEHKGVFGQKCADCHIDKSWKEANFDHKQQEGHFELLGKHDSAKCASCHKSAGQKLPMTCIGCHRSDDKHQGSLGEKCADCHVTKKTMHIKVSLARSVAIAIMRGIGRKIVLTTTKRTFRSKASTSPPNARAAISMD